MTKVSWGRAKWLALIIVVAAAAGTFAARRMQVTLAEADKFYNEKSYADALKAYQTLIKSGELSSARKDEAQYRIAVSLGKTQQWDRAVAESLEFVKTHRETVWEPRGLYWLGRLYLGMPHQGFRVGPRVYRGNDVPKQTESDAKPDRVDVSVQDRQNSHDAFEASRVLYGAYRQKEHTQEEEVQLDFDLARVLTESPDYFLWVQKQAWAKPDAPEWTVDTSQTYDPKWPFPKRLMYLYAQIPMLSEPLKDGSHQSALGLFGKALWLKQYHNLMASYAIRYENGDQTRIPYPYENEKSEDALRALIKQFPDDAIRDQAQYTLAAWYQQTGNWVTAVEELHRLIEQRPNNKWVEDARRDLEQITLKQLSLNAGGLQMSGQQPKLNVGFRNLPAIRFRAFKVRLEDGLKNAEANNNPNHSLNEYQELFGNIANLEQRFGAPAAHWELDTKDKGDYANRSETVTVPIQEAGAYIIEASGPGIKTATVLLLTDLALVQKTHRDGGLFFIADAKTGASVPQAQVVAKQFWYEGNSEHSAFTRVQTDAQGLATVPLLRAPGRSNFRIQAAAVRGSQYAMTDALYTYDYNDNPNLIQVYSVTDRAVYRPTQRVYYRQLVMRHDKGELVPVVNQSVHIRVQDPQGKVIHENDLRTSEFGSVKGEFDLSHNVPLGEYNVNVTVPRLETGGTQLGGNRFRVEEYKKPEFEVAVTPASERVRLGEPTSATVHASYYFGGPVPNAKVTYRIYRNYYAQSYRFPRPFDFLYNYSDNGDYNNYYRNGAVILQGETQTNAQGDAKITFPTKPAPNTNYYAGDLAYTIDADVQDASRRVISGSGSVKATRHDVAVFLDFPHGFATQGDRVDVEIMTLNPSNQPVSVSGKAKVYREPATLDAKETLIYEEPLKTDKQGRGFFKWKDAPSGYFRIAFETHDTAEQEVASSLPLWIEGKDLNRGGFLFQQISLLVENPYYEQDQTARVLLITPVPDTTVLLIREANNEVLSKEVVKVSGRSLELKVPLTQKDVPNVFMTAIAVRNGEMLQATQELFVPPVKQFASISVQADKAQYQPGERARLRLSATDWMGRPLHTELSVAVTDASLNYIQKDYEPDIRVYYYGNRRSISNPVGGSFNTQVSQDISDSQKHGEYKTHEWVLPEGMGMLPDWPGAERQAYYYLYGYYNGPQYGRGGGRGFGGFGGFGGDGFREERDFAGAESGKDKFLAAQEPAGAPRPSGDVISVGDKTANLRSDTAFKRKGGVSDAESALESPSVRSHFADTAFWTPAIVTDAQGHATVEVTWPDNLTQWRANAVGTTSTAQVGSGETRVRTKKDLIVRLQAPRFFVERDTLLLTANVQNYLPHAAKVKVSLDLGDSTAEIVNHKDTKNTKFHEEGSKESRKEGAVPDASFRDDDAGHETGNRKSEIWVEVPKDGEKRVDWQVHVRREGSLHVRMSAQASAASDATEMTFPVLVHGVERATAQNGVLREQTQATLAISLPKARKPGSSELVVNLNPSLATIMLDALPYLNKYPYGCIEQTMSRFLPSVIVAHTLKESGYDLETLGKRAKLLKERAVGTDKRQKIVNSPYTYPRGRPGILQTEHLASPEYNPVFDTQELKSMTLDGLARIQQAQHSDGGWGWWPGDSSDPFMTAYVLYGLMLGKRAGYTIDQNMLDRGMKFLNSRFLEDDNFHRMAYEARTLAMDNRYYNSIRPLVTGRIFTNRERLSAYSKALLAIALHDLGDNEKASVLLRNLQTTAKVDPQNGTANWNGIDGYWWHWYNDKVETNAVVLQAYLAIQPESPMPPMIVKWLTNNRRANSWYNTRATAMAVYALADYARVTKELAPDYTLTVDLGGHIRRVYTVNHDNALFFDNQFVVPDELLHTGNQTLTITKKGRGSCYYGAFTRYFSLEEPIKETGNEIFVKRRYYRLIANTASGQPSYKPVDLERPNPFLTGKYELLDAGGEYTDWQDGSDGPRYERVALKEGDTVTSGDQLEVELQLESKNDYEYLAFEDLKPAGCEPVELRSGGKMGLGVYSNMELRDQKVAFFIRSMPQGTRTLTYRLRAEIPGTFHVLPTNGYAMYAPDIRCLSNEMLLDIRDSESPALKAALK